MHSRTERDEFGLGVVRTIWNVDISKGPSLLRCNLDSPSDQIHSATQMRVSKTITFRRSREQVRLGKARFGRVHV